MGREKCNTSWALNYMFIEPWKFVARGIRKTSGIATLAVLVMAALVGPAVYEADKRVNQTHNMTKHITEEEMRNSYGLYNRNPLIAQLDQIR